jgi:hypothetical protein
MSAYRNLIVQLLADHASGLRLVAAHARNELTEGERLLISKAADNVAAAYRIISTGDPNAT